MAEKITITTTVGSDTMGWSRMDITFNPQDYLDSANKSEFIRERALLGLMGGTSKVAVQYNYSEKQAKFDLKAKDKEETD